MGSTDLLRLPKINFSGLDPANPGTDEWIAVRSQVMAALETYSCFEAVYDKVTSELGDALFGKTMKEVFSLPLEAKLKNTSDKPYHGYVGSVTGMNYESLIIDEATNREGAEKFAATMWGAGGNPSFCDTVCSFAKKVAELDQMTRRMVLESFGIEKYYDSHIMSTKYSLRVSEYGAPQTQEAKTTMAAHTDMTMVSIVCQHGMEGLEILTKDGTWITPSPKSFTIMIGETFGAFTNGRLEPPYHRVFMAGNETRYSAILTTHPRDGYIVKAPDELVDEEHPLQFKPYDYSDYIRFCFSEAGQKAGAGQKALSVLRAYCGVGGCMEAEA